MSGKPAEGQRHAWAILIAACALAACWACSGPAPASRNARNVAKLSHEHYRTIQSRATNSLDLVDFFKPAESSDSGQPFSMAPLILQAHDGQNDRFGMPEIPGAAQSPRSRLSPDPGFAINTDSPAVFFGTGQVRIGEREYPQLIYRWFYPASTNAGPTRLPRSQGLRITLDALGTGQPLVWEVLNDSSGADILYVTESLEKQALLQFGPPLPGRRFSVERSLEESPNTVVARILDDGPTPMGPFIYLEPGTHDVITVICRCMPSQAKTLANSINYSLLPGALLGGKSELRENQAKPLETKLRWPNPKR